MFFEKFDVTILIPNFHTMWKNSTPFKLVNFRIFQLVSDGLKENFLLYYLS